MPNDKCPLQDPNQTEAVEAALAALQNDSDTRSSKQKELQFLKIKCLNGLGFDGDPHDDKWEEYFAQLQRYKIKNGHCDNVPCRTKLSSWVSQQRMSYKKGKLDDSKIERLNSLGFDWDPVKNQWQRRFEALQNYKEKHGRFPPSCERRLYSWMSSQRVAYKEGKLDAWKVEHLNRLGFDCERLKNVWNRFFEQLKAYREQYGHCKLSYRRNKALYGWAAIQKAAYKKGKLDAWKVGSLNTLGFNWAFIKTWDEHFYELKEYKNKHGHCKVPKNSFRSLASWSGIQRKLYKIGKLHSSKIEKLNALGFNWGYCLKKWDVYFSELEHYKKHHGHCHVPKNISNTLNKWVITQRVACKKNKLGQLKVEKLNALGFTWDLRKNRTVKS